MRTFESSAAACLAGKKIANCCTSLSSQLMNGSNKLEITLSLLDTNTTAYSDHIELYIGLGPYSQQFIFFATYKWAKQARVFHYTNLARYKHYSLLGPDTKFTLAWGYLHNTSFSL